MAVRHQKRGPVDTDPRYRALLETRAVQERQAARGTAAWSRDDATGLPREPLRIPELILGALLAMEAFGVRLGPLGVPLSEAAMLLLLFLALCRRSRRDTSALGLSAVLAGAVMVFLAVVSVNQGIPDMEWLRRWVRIAALVGLVGCIAGGRLDLRSVLTGLLAAMAANVPLFYAGVVPAPYGSFLTGFLADKNVAGLYYAAMPVLALAVVRSRRWKLAILLAAAVCLFLTGSRTSMAGFGVALVWLAVTPRLAAGLRVVLLVVLGWAVGFAEENLSRLAVFGDRTGTDWLRGTIQAATEAKAATTPWHGRGLTEAYVTIGQDTWHYHDSYAGLFTEGGVVLLLAVLGAYAFFGLRVFSTRLRTPSRVAVEAAAAVVFVTATQLGEVFITIPGMLIVAAGVSLWLRERDAPLESEVRERRRRQVLAAARRGATPESSVDPAAPGLG
ncbi:O-antigen ligase family protein [Micrococcus endophyticus]|uniref:O-antigen ligase family protein n=1 Tax=Micrococcus endophyticus TaxID=455343 RepID=UPI00161F10B7|nr:O-antigen ligase family protein [Micrococcus endophyticus]